MGQDEREKDGRKGKGGPQNFGLVYNNSADAVENESSSTMPTSS